MILTLFFLSTLAISYQDLDIDGVDDTIDMCKDTPFDELVDENGCSKTQKPSHNYGHLTVKIGTDIFTDKDYENDSSLTLYANYRYKNWDISLSNSRSTTNNNSYSEDNSYSDNDIYISLGDTFVLPKKIIKLSIGTKIAGDIDNNRIKKMSNRGEGYRREYKNNHNSYYNTQTIDNNRDNDYFASINYNYLLDEKKNIFLYYGYTLSGDSKTTDYKDYSSFSIGAGYLLTSNWYGALSYNYTGSIYKDIDASKSIEIFSSYNFTKNIFASIGYSYALEDVSYDNSFSLAMGLTF